MNKFFAASLVALSMIVVGAGMATASNAGLGGWAWSSNIGWISLSSSTPDSGGGEYGVTLDTATGALGGYAWSSNIGWISFNPSDIGSGCPTGGNCAPRINMTTGTSSGWALVLSDNRWIELSGTKHVSSICTQAEVAGGTCRSGLFYDKTTGAFSGFAWEPVIMGWTSFNASATSTARIISCTPPDPSCPVIGPNDSPDFTISADSIVLSSPEYTGTINVQFNRSRIWDTTPFNITLSLSNPQTSKLTAISTSNSCSLTSNISTCTVPVKIDLADKNPKITTTYFINATGTAPYSTTTLAHGKSIGITVDTTAPVQQKCDVGPVCLFIGKTVVSASSSLYTTVASRTFGLAWNNKLSDDPETGYTCTSSVNPTYTSKWSIFDQKVIASGTGSPRELLTTSGVVPGRYAFTITCDPNSKAPEGSSRVSATATLRVVSASSQEI